MANVIIKNTADFNMQLMKMLCEDEEETDKDNYQLDIDRVTAEKTALQNEILDETKINNKYKQLHNVEAKLENTCSKHKTD